ncbi:MAG: T9SS type A sorting domain-containing protein [Armatimonadetes bacterium]|nr:T9SS type A sorting domain-containing protein [Armatimonadota bacterium]
MQTRQTAVAVLATLLMMGLLSTGITTNHLHAQTIAWDVMGAGGGIGDRNGTQAISATVGQPIVGPTVGNRNAIQQGFWLPIARTSSVSEQSRNEATARLTNYPNPFAGSTTIHFRLPASGTVRLRVVDLMGREVRTIANQAMETGEHSIAWDARDGTNQPVAAGHYICRLEFQPTASLTGGTTTHTTMMHVHQ